MEKQIGNYCIRCGAAFTPRQYRTRPRQHCYQCSPEGRNTTQRINDECKRDPKAYFRQLRQKGRRSLRAAKLKTGDLMQMWETQKGLCAISGMKMTHEWGRENVWNASPDQIIPASKGGDYSPSNVRLICKLFQTMRGNLNDHDFKEAIIKAADHIRASEARRT